MFDTWADLYAALQALRAASNGSGCFAIDFDDVIVSPCPIPPGAYDMTMVDWVAQIADGADVAVSDGATFTQLRRFEDNVHVSFAGKTPPITDFVNGDIVYVNRGATLESAGPAPFMLNAASDTVIVVLDLGGALNTGGAPVFHTGGAARSLIALTGTFSSVRPKTLSSDKGATVEITTGASGIGSASEDQPALLGGLNPQNQTKTRLNPTPMPPMGPFTGNVTLSEANVLALVDPSSSDGPLVVQLPPAAGYSVNRGQIVIIKSVVNSDDKAATISVVPQGSDKIDDALSVSIGGPYASATFVSDGVDQWRRV